MKNNKTIKIVIIIVAVVIVSLLISPFLPETENTKKKERNVPATNCRHGFAMMK